MNIKKKVLEIKEVVGVGEGKALVALSGGVDSSVVTMLGKRALGERLVVVFVDTGLMRQGEPEWVVDTFKKLGIDVLLIDESDRFFAALEDLDEDDPDKGMRPIFSRTFYEVLREIGDIYHFLIQGTNKADIEETRKKIKLQHNVDIDPLRYGFSDIVEPLKDLYKDEIREMARELRLPEEIINRPPFPGPGLACRCYPPLTRERIAIVRQASAIVEEVIEEDTNFYKTAYLFGTREKPFQFFPVLMGDKACGIMADKACGAREARRVWGHIITIRCVDSKDAVYAKATNLPWSILEKIKARLTQEIPSVTRVLYDLTDKEGPQGPATIEFL